MEQVLNRQKFGTRFKTFLRAFQARLKVVLMRPRTYMTLQEFIDEERKKSKDATRFIERCVERDLAYQRAKLRYTHCRNTSKMAIKDKKKRLTRDLVKAANDLF